MRSLAFLVTISLLSNIANSATVETIINECSKENDHPRMSHCVASRATSARHELDIVEREMREAIAKSDENTSYLKPVQQRFEGSVSSYHKYRDEQCSLREALANMGIYAVEIRLACEAELDSNRTQELKSDMWWLK